MVSNLSLSCGLNYKRAQMKAGKNIQNSVRYSIRSSVWDSIRVSVMGSIWVSVRGSIWVSVRDSVWGLSNDLIMNSVWDSIRDSTEGAGLKMKAGKNIQNPLKIIIWYSTWCSVGKLICISAIDSAVSSVRNHVWGIVESSVLDLTCISVWRSIKRKIEK